MYRVRVIIYRFVICIVASRKNLSEIHKKRLQVGHFLASCTVMLRFFFSSPLKGQWIDGPQFGLYKSL